MLSPSPYDKSLKWSICPYCDITGNILTHKDIVKDWSTKELKLIVLDINIELLLKRAHLLTIPYVDSVYKLIR